MDATAESQLLQATELEAAPTNEIENFVEHPIPTKAEMEAKIAQVEREMFEKKPARTLNTHLHQHASGSKVMPKGYLDQYGAELRQFTTDIALAKRGRYEMIEASEEVINYFNPAGLGGAKYFIYEGIKVMPAGKVEEILNAEGMQMDQLLHGTKMMGIVS